MSAKLWNGRITRQQWWTCMMGLLAALFVLNLAIGFAVLVIGFAVPGNLVLSGALSLILLVPLAAVCAWRLNDLGRPLMPTLPLLIAPFFVHTLVSRITSLGLEETAVATGVNDVTAIVAGPNLLGWFALAWLVGTLGYMAFVLGGQAARQMDVSDTAVVA